MSTPAPPPQPPPSPDISLYALPIMDNSGGNGAEIAIFAAFIGAFFIYHVYYFSRHRLRFSSKKSFKQLPNLDMWTTALESRVLWAREVMQNKDEALLVVQTLRNIIIAATLIVSGIGQVLGRLFQILTQETSMRQLARYAAVDPISHGSFAPPPVKVGVATAILMLSFGAFAQSARIAVHMSFMFRVAPSIQGHRLEMPLKSELIEMTHRVSITFTVGIRLLFLFAMLISWSMGITAFACFSALIMLLLTWSDYLPSELHSGTEHAVLEGGVGGEIADSPDLEMHDH